MNFKNIFIEKDKVKPDCPSEGVFEYWLVNKDLPSENVSLAIVKFGKNISSGSHRHNVEEIFYFLKGSGKVIVGTEERNIKPGLCVYIPKNILHNIIGTQNNSIEVIVILGGINIKTEYI